MSSGSHGEKTTPSIPNTMTAVEIGEFGDPDVLRPVTRPLPTAGDRDVLIRVRAAGVSRPDALQRRGLYPPPPGTSDIPGLEVAGTIVAAGRSAGAFGAGQAVCALVAGGGYAEYCAAPAEQVLPVPKNWTMVEAASLPENYFTVWTNVFERGRLRAGETMLVHGGTSGIGTTAITLARAFGVRVFATAGSPEKCRAAERLGAERAFNYREQDFVQETSKATGGRGVDLILDMVGGDYIERDVEALAVEGRLVIIAFQRGPTATLELMRLMQKRAHITGSTLRARSPAEKGIIRDALRANVWPLLEERRIQPVIDTTYPLVEAARAHAKLESGAHVGKIVLEVP